MCNTLLFWVVRTRTLVNTFIGLALSDEEIKLIKLNQHSCVENTSIHNILTLSKVEVYLIKLMMTRLHLTALISPFWSFVCWLAVTVVIATLICSAFLV